jgi:hypothetical protein
MLLRDRSKQPNSINSSRISILSLSGPLWYRAQRRWQGETDGSAECVEGSAGKVEDSAGEAEGSGGVVSGTLTWREMSVRPLSVTAHEGGWQGA